MEIEFPDHLMTIGLITFNTQVDHLYYMKTVQLVYTMNHESYMPNESITMLDFSIRYYFDEKRKDEHIKKMF